jgi:hypothetical protein
MNDYPHEVGEWTLVSPSGRTWKSDAPLKAAAAEQRDRIPATVRLARIMADMSGDCPHAAPFRYCPECVSNPCPIGMPPNASTGRSDT